ncbi:heavy metal translocating P-type ATPase metal-binding domain-containing protein [Ferrovibrio sp.]|uniref:heavy metal translocating P-type ATPase n=1 Tax=Ferrovibrio sp. TaxID=1917215 RepID=UPI0035AFCBE3
MNAALLQLTRGDVAGPAASAATACVHCGGEIGAAPIDGRFCCRGCSGAYAIIKGLGLEQYYALRGNAALGERPETATDGIDWNDFVVPLAGDKTAGYRIELLVEGLHCAACLWLIEQALHAQPDVTVARVSATTRRLHLEWKGKPERVNALGAIVQSLGYRCLPYTAEGLERAGQAEEKALLRAMAVAGFAAANIMLLSVSVWSGHLGSMGPATRDLFHLLSGLIAIPTILYAGQPFFRSAYAALRQGRSNMDVPISIGVTLAAAVSVAELVRSGPHAYFDAAVTLLFFLLVGRYLDRRARGVARRGAERLIAFTARPVTVLTAEGPRQRPAARVQLGDRVLAASGERIAVDGVVREGVSALDASLIDGETMPRPIAPGGKVFAGMINLDAPLQLDVTAVGRDTLLGEIARLMEAAEQGKGRFVQLADKVARYYAPVVHLTALLSFLGWVFIGDADIRNAILIAAAVLIITCPCALALAVPVVQVVASSRLMAAGILLKSASALERSAGIDTIVFDKTGTLTMGEPRLLVDPALRPEDLRAAAELAARSRHPLCRALLAACPDAWPAEGVEEVSGGGLRRATPDGEMRLGNARFCGLPPSDDAMPGSEICFTRPGAAPLRFRFQDALRSDAAETIATLRGRGYRMLLLSGDRMPVVREIAGQLGIAEWRAETDPLGKAACIADLQHQGHRVLMVGDGLNDAVALAAADASLSPTSALDVAQNAADAVFRGGRLMAVADFLKLANASRRLTVENLGLALVYNLFAVPLAIAGFVTPLVAAVAMSSSSLVVVLNALRLPRGQETRKQESQA